MHQPLLLLIVSVWTWFYPQPANTSGWLVNYGTHVVERTAEFNGYDLAPYAGRCGIAAMSPAMLGRIAWVRVNAWVTTGEPRWFGPCLVIDSSRQSDFYANVFVRGEAAEIPMWLIELFGSHYGMRGEVYFGVCPPMHGQASPYHPPLEFATLAERNAVATYPRWYVPPQEMPVRCTGSSVLPLLPP